MASLPLRQIEGKYEILEKIKEGGMGAIYKVRHLLLDEIRVIKVIRPQIADSKDLQRRFAREARAAIRLKHPNIAQLYDFAVEPEGVAYMVMEFIDGVTLQEMLARNGPAQIDLTLEIARQGLQALRYLHLQGYVHRDIAPDNLMLSKDYDGRPLVKLIDLGIVKHLEGAGDGLTATGMFLGKVRYSSPEQFSGEKGTLDHRSDIYSFGVMLYELLTGKCPILGENLSQLVAAHLFQPPLGFEETDPQHRVPQDIRDVVLRALHKSPEKRFASAQEFHDLLSRHPPAETLAQDLDDTLSVTISRRLESDRPLAGTTQDKLDAQFGLVRTPRPEVGLRAVDGAAAGTDADTIERLLGEAQLLVHDRQWEGARRTLYRALAIHPDHPEARRLLSSAEGSLAQAIAAEKERQQGIANAVESIEALLRSEHLEQAIAALEGARSGYGEEARFAALATRIAELRGALAERERQLAISRAVASIDELLQRENAEEARIALAAALAAHGAESRFTELARRTERVAAALEQRRREQAVAARCAAIGGLLAQENAEEAARVLEEARAEDGEDARFVQLQSDLAALRAVLAERERRAALETTLASIASALREEDVESAATALQSAVARFGSEKRLAQLDAELDRLRRRVAERREQEAAAARRARAGELLAAAVVQGKRRDYRTAIANAAEALELDPDSADALRLLLEYRQAEMEEREKQRRGRALSRAATAIEALLAREAADDAAKALGEARRELGEDARLVELDQRLLALRDRLAERRRQREIAAAVGEIEAHLDAEAADAAQRGLEAAIVGLGEDERLVGLRERIGALRRELAEKERRLALAQAIAQIEERLRAEQIGEATGALKQAIERLGAEPRLLALRVAAVDLRRRLELRARSEALTEVDAAARSLTAGERFDEAELMLDAARHQHDGDPILDRLAQHIAGARRECDQRRRAEAVARAAASVERLVVDGDLEEASRMVELAVREQGADPRFAAAAARIEEARRRREEEARTRAREEALASAVAVIEAKVVREEADQAARSLEAAVASYGKDSRFDSLAKRIARLRGELAQRLRREEEARRQEELRSRREEEAQREQEERAKREEEVRVQRQREARARHEEEARVQREQEAQVKREQEARARREEEARREQEAQAKREQEARARREEEARREQEAQAKREQEARARREEEARREQEAQAKREQEARARREEEARAREDQVRPQQVPATPGLERRRWPTKGMVAAASMAGLALVGGVLWLWPRSPAPSRSAEVASVGDTAPAEVVAPPRAIPNAEPVRQEPAGLPPASQPAAAPPSEPAPTGRDDEAGREGASRLAADPAGAGATASTTRPAKRSPAPEPAASALKETEGTPAERKAELSRPAPLPVEVLRPSPAAADAQTRTGSPDSTRRSASEAPRGQEAVPPAVTGERPQQKASTPPDQAPQASAGSRAGEVSTEKRDPIVVPPVLKSLPQPRLPAIAERQRRQAVILVRVLIDESGNVLEAEVQDDDPEKRIFFEEALRVARKARFEPGTRDGVESRMHSTIPVQFRLR